MRTSRTFLLAVSLALAVPVPAAWADAPMFAGGPTHAGAFGAGPRALDRPAWIFHTDGRFIGSPAVAGGLLFIGSTNGSLYAVHVADGRQAWKVATGGRICATPAVAGGLVYVTSYDGNVYAFDAANGKQRWRFATRGERRFAVAHLNGLEPANDVMPDPFDFYQSSPTVALGTVFVGSGDGNVYALDARSGALRWRYRTGNVVHTSPAVAGGLVYAGSFDTYLYALDATRGTLVWRFKTGDDPVRHNQTGITSSPAVVDGVVYFGSRDHHVYALDARTGRRRWSAPTGGTAWASGSPAVAGGTVFVAEGSSRVLRALDARTGATKFVADAKSAFFASPAVSGDLVYAGDFNGKVRAFDRTTGADVATFVTVGGTLPVAKDRTVVPGTSVAEAGPFYDAVVATLVAITASAILASPVVDDGTLYVAGGDGNVYAFR
jgi:eukaryotic-like serine/threonine-protein kinase